jgi:hypothetical protein
MSTINEREIDGVREANEPGQAPAAKTPSR